MIDLTQYHIFDGGMGTMLQARGLAAGECPERLNCSDTRTVEAVHAAYLQAGADIITTNTFGASRRKLGRTRPPNIAAASMPPAGRERPISLWTWGLWAA